MSYLAPRIFKTLLLSSLLTLPLISCGGGDGNDADEFSNDLRFFGYPEPGADANRGARVFGAEDITATSRIQNCVPGAGCEALFEGQTDDGTQSITSNGRVCADCHRLDANFQLGSLLPLDNTVPDSDPLIRFVDADAQFHPDGLRNLKQLGLILIRPYRFSGLAQDDPFRKATVWRKIPTNFNTALGHGFPNDFRDPQVRDNDISASQSHTQLGDATFRNVLEGDEQRLADLQAFQFSLFSDPRLEALLYPGDDRFSPSFDELAADPYLTVNIENEQQERGKDVFNRFCYTCHNVPNVFNNRAYRDPRSNRIAGQGYDIGISQANMNNLDFRFFNQETGQLESVTIPLERADGEIVQFEMTTDPGLALITGKFEDLYVFKVPQLRNLELVAPFMHDGSLKTIEDLVRYFNSPQYNNSAGGRAFPISMTPQEEADLVAFLKQL